ncbi:MAG: class I SAM-dependent methyltransferase [Christensenellaceae bacterium]|jgi:ubiquinone/menaquinone biosynthesis C-methylase UbiE|nr:class I SAM-dependent methyltransferase [Christensenellaceae bacterium]
MHEEYGTLSTKFYELSKPVGHSIDGDIEYYFEKLKNIKGKILEAGVGTGRMFIPFLKRGLNIDGVDLSSEMLKQCSINMKAHGVSAELYHQDLTKLSLKTKYDAIVMPTGSFCLLPKNTIMQTLSLFREHLRSGGKIIIDIELLPEFSASEQNIRSIKLENLDELLLTTTSESIDFKNQKILYINKYELKSGGNTLKTEVSRFVLYWYDIYEFEQLLKQAGFNYISYQIGYGTNNNSSCITFIATN